MPIRNSVVSRTVPSTSTRSWSDGQIEKLATTNFTETVKRKTTVTPNYQQRVKAGTLPINPLLYERLRVEYMEGFYTFVDTRPGARDAVYTGNYGIPDEFVYNAAADWDATVASAVSSALSKIKNQKINLAQMFAERAQTARLIETTATRLATSFTNLRRGNYRGAVGALGCAVVPWKERKFRIGYPRSPRRAVEDGWLELQYGWRPLISDVYGSVEAIADARLPKLERVVSKRALKKSDVLNSGDAYVTRTSIRKSEATVKIILEYEVSNPALQTTSSLGLTNPATLAWELLPYSFVVDWFVPIGNWLNNFDATLGVSFKRGAQVVHQHLTVVSTEIGRGKVADFAGGYVQTYTGGMKGQRELVSVSVDPLTTFPPAPVPRFKNPLSFVHAANALALLSAAFRR